MGCGRAREKHRRRCSAVAHGRVATPRPLCAFVHTVHAFGDGHRRVRAREAFARGPRRRRAAGRVTREGGEIRVDLDLRSNMKWAVWAASGRRRGPKTRTSPPPALATLSPTNASRPVRPIPLGLQRRSLTHGPRP